MKTIAGFRCGLILCALLATCGLTKAQSTWVPTAAGTYDWSTGSYWSTNPTVPNAIDAIANINIDIVGAQIINLGANRTLGTLNLGDGGTGTDSTITIATNTLIFQTGAGTAALNIASGSDAANAISAAVTLNSGLVVTHAGAGTLTIGGVVSGTGALTKVGSGTMVLTGANTFSGGTTVSAGTLQAAVSTTINSLGTGAASVAGGSTLQINNTNTSSTGVTIGNAITGSGLLKVNFAAGTTARNTTMNGLTGFTGTIQLSNAGATSDKWALSASTPGTIGAALIIDSGSQLFAGTGTNTTFSNGITVTGTGNGETRGAIRLIGTVGGNVTLGGATTIGTEGGTLTGNIALGANTLTLGTASSTGDATLSGVISGSGALIKVTTNGANSGRLTLSGNNTFTGAVTISNGIVKITNSNALGTGTKTITMTNGTNGLPVLELDGSGGNISLGTNISFKTSSQATNGAIRNLAGDNTIAGAFTLSSGGGNTHIFSDAGSLTLTGGISADTTSRVLVLGGASTGANVISGVISNSSTPAVQKTGTGTWTLSGANLYAGTTTISAGTLKLGNPTALGTTGGATSVASGGVLDLNGQAVGTEALTLNGTGISSGGALINSSATAASLSGTIALGSASSIGGNGTGAMTLSGVISGGYALTKVGTGTTILSGANTFTGGVTVTDGSLRISNASALGTGTVVLVSNTGSPDAVDTNALQLAGNITAGAGKTLILRNGGSALSRTYLVNSADTNTWQGDIQLENTSNQSIDAASGTLNLTGTVFNNPASPSTSLFIRGDNGTCNFSGLFNLGSTTLLKTGGGLWNIDSTNNVHGNVQVADGTLVIRNNNALSPFSALTLGQSSSNNPTLTINTGFTQTFTGVTVLTASGTHKINGGGTLDFGSTNRSVNVADGTQSDDLTISTAITGSGGFTKLGAGTLVLDNNTTAGPITLGAGTTRGSFTASGGLTVNAGATLVPGTASAAGTITTSTLTFGTGSSTLNFNADTSADLIVTTGMNGLTANGSTTVNIVTLGTSLGLGTYDLIQYNGTMQGSGLAGFTLGALPGRALGGLIDTGTALALSVTGNDQVKWNGLVNADWNVNTTQNWITVVGMTGTNYLEGDDLLFDDTGANRTINVASAVNPSKMTFNNGATKTYTFTGTNAIAGSGSLTVAGGGLVVLQNPNTYTGVTTINSGTLEVDSDGGSLTGTSRVAVGAAGTLRLTANEGTVAFTRTLSGTGTVRVNQHSVAAGGTNQSATLTGDASGFTGTLILESPLSGSSRLNGPTAAALGGASIVVENENQLYCVSGATYTNNITLTGDGYNDASGSIGAMRMGDSGSTWNGTITVTGTAGDSGGTAYDARIGATGGTSTFNGSITGGDLQVWSYGTASISHIYTAANSFGDLIIGGSDETGAGGQAAVIIGANNAVPTNTTATLGAGNVYLVAGSNATQKTAILRINRADGYTLAQDILGSASTSAGLAKTYLYADTLGTGLSLGGRTVDLSDGTNGGYLRVGTITTGAILNIDTGSNVDVGGLWVGETANISGVVNQAAGSTVTSAYTLRVGHYGTETSTYNMNGGTINFTAANPATAPFTAGSTEQSGGLYVGVDGTGVFNQNDGTVNTNFLVLDNRTNTAAGTNMVDGIDRYNLNGGTLNIKNPWGVSGNVSTEFLFNGGTLKIDNTSGINMPVSVPVAVSGTASVLDTNVASNSVTFSQNIGGSGTLTIQNGGTVVLSTTGTQTVSAVLAGGSALSKQGAGTTTLSSASTYTGATTVSAGTFNLTGSLAFSDLTAASGSSIGGEGSAQSLTLNGATVLVDPSTAGALTSNGNLSLTGTTTVSLSGYAGTSPIRVLNYGLTGTYSNTGTLVLGNATNYRGGTFNDTVPGQIDLNLTTADIEWAGTSGAWDLNTTASFQDSVPVAQKFYWGDRVTFDDTGAAQTTVTLTGDLRPGSVTFSEGTNYVLSGTGGINGTTGITKNGTSTVTLGGANTFTGAINVNGGILKLGSATGFGSASAITVASGAQIHWNGQAPGATKSYSLSIAGNGPDGLGAVVNDTTSIAANAGIVNLTLTADASVGTYGGTLPGGNRIDFGYNGSAFGTINGNGYTLTKIGEAMVNVRAPATNISYVINAGTLRAENSSLALGSTGVTVNYGARLENYGTLDFAVPVTLNEGSTLGSANSVGSWSNLTLGGNTTLDATGTVLVNSALSGGTNISLTGTGTVAINSIGNSGFTGKWIVSSTNAGYFRIASDSSLGAVPGAPVADAISLTNGARLQGSVYTGATAAGTNLVLDANRGIYLPVAGQNGGFQTWTAFTTTVNGTITGPGNLTVTDAGTTILNGAINIGGDIQNNNGVVNINSASLVSGGGLHGYTGTTNLNVGTATLDNIRLGQASGNAHTVNQIAGDITVTADVRLGHLSNETSIYNMQSGTLTLTGTVTNPDDEAQSMLFIGIDGTGVFNQTGGTVSVPGINMDGRGPTEGTDRLTLTGGTLNVGAQGIRTGAGSTSAGYLIQLGGGTLGASANWSSSLAMDLTGYGGNATINTGSNSVWLSGVLSGKGGFAKTGGGDLQLSGANTYTGATSVNAGTLTLASSGSIASSTTTVATGASLLGLGTAGTTLLNGTINPGMAAADVGTLSTGALTFGTTGIFAADIKSTTGSANLDKIIASGNLSILLGAQLALTEVGANDALSGTNKLVLINYTGYTWDTGIFTGYADDSTFTLGANKWKIDYNDTTDGVTAGNYVTLTTVPSSPYAVWAATFGLGATSQNNDDDLDGVKNLAEFALDGNPLLAGNLGKRFARIIDLAGDGDGPTLTFIIPVRVGTGDPFTGATAKSATRDLVTYTIQGSADLAAWTTVVVTDVTSDTAAAAAIATLPALTSGTEWQYRAFRAPGDVDSPTKSFLRATFSHP